MAYNMDRKTFLKLTGGAGVFTLIGGTGWLLQSCSTETEKKNVVTPPRIQIIEGDFTTALPSPPLLDLAAGEFAAMASSVEILKGKKTEVYGYYEGILGKTIVVNKGDRLKLSDM